MQLFSFIRVFKKLWSDKSYHEHKSLFLDLNSIRVTKFSFLIAVANIVLIVLPNLLFYNFSDLVLDQAYKNLLLLQGSLSIFLLIFHLVARWIGTENKQKDKKVLTFSFIFIILLHAFGISLVSHGPDAPIPIYLIIVCALMVGLHWSTKQLLFIFGGTLLLFSSISYYIYDDSLIFFRLTLSELPFLGIFCFLSKSVTALKINEVVAVLAKNNSKAGISTDHAIAPILQNVQQGVFRLVEGQGFTYVNDYLAEMLGYTSAAEFVVSVPETDFIKTEDLRTIARKVHYQGYIEGYEILLKDRFNNSIWVQMNCSVLRDQEKQRLVFEGTIRNISERKRIIHDALENVSRLEQIEKISNTGFFELHLSSGRILYSSGLCHILDISSQGVTELTLTEHLQFVHPEDKKEAKEVLLYSITNCKGFQLEHRVITKQGDIKFLSIKAQAVKQEYENKVKILCAVHDITNQKINELALAQSEAFIKAAFDNEKYGIVLIDKSYKIINFNPECARRVETWRRTKIKKGLDIRLLISPSNNKKFSGYFERAFNGFNSTFEANLATDSPQEIWAELYVSPLRNKVDEVIGIMIIGREITKRKKYEKLLANLSLTIDNTENPVIIFNDKQKIEWANDALKKVLGFDFKELKGKPFDKAFLPEILNTEDIAKLNEHLGSGTGLSCEVVIKAKTGEEKYFYLTLNSLKGNDGKLVKHILILTDLSSRKAFEKELLDAKESAERSVSAKDSFLATISHEIRTPLNAVIGMAHHLSQNNPRTDQQEDLNILKFSAENLLLLINDILDLAKIEAGKMQLEKKPFNLKDLVNNLQHTFSNQAASKNIQFDLSWNNKVPKVLSGDSTRLIQILSNLLSNAIKFTAEGSVSLQISSHIKNEKECDLIFTVEDTGIGIEEGKLTQIFDKFEQVSYSTFGTYGGTGLGLAITKQLVELIGGSIKVNSQEGIGTTFHVTLPYEITEEENIFKLASFEIKKSLVNTVNLLLVEDNEINQTVVTKFLKAWQINYAIAANGEEAIAKARSEYFSIILMDIQMPVMEGFEATQKIRQIREFDYRNTPIIALTAGGNTNLQESIQAAGMNDLLFKPFKPAILLDKIKQYNPNYFFMEEYTQFLDGPQKELQKTSYENGLDLTGITTFAGNDIVFIHELLRLYLKQFYAVPQNILDAFKNHDYLQLRRIFHKIRPSISMLKQHELLQLCDQIHTLLHQDKADEDDLELKLNQFLKRTDMLKKLIEEELEPRNFVLG